MGSAQHPRYDSDPAGAGAGAPSRKDRHRCSGKCGRSAGWTDQTVGGHRWTLPFAGRRYSARRGDHRQRGERGPLGNDPSGAGKRPRDRAYPGIAEDRSAAGAGGICPDRRDQKAALSRTVRCAAPALPLSRAGGGL